MCAFRLNYSRDFQEFSRRRRRSAAGPYLCANIRDLKNVRCTFLQTCAPLNASRDTVDQVTRDKRNLAWYAFIFADGIRVRDEDKNRIWLRVLMYLYLILHSYMVFSSCSFGLILILTEIQARPSDCLYSPEAAIDCSVHVSALRQADTSISLTIIVPAYMNSYLRGYDIDLWECRIILLSKKYDVWGIC